MVVRCSYNEKITRQRGAVFADRHARTWLPWVGVVLGR